jgi:hypothetical protein
MPHALVDLIELLGIDAVELPHAFGEVAIGGFQDEVIMVVHETKGMAEPVVMQDDIGQEIQKALAIGIIQINGRTGIATRGDVMEGAGKFNA